MSFLVTRRDLMLFSLSLHFPKSQLDYEGNVKKKILLLHKLTKTWEETLFCLSRWASEHQLAALQSFSRTAANKPIHSYLHMLPPTWKYLQANYVSFSTELQRDLATWIATLLLLMFCWVHLCPRNWFTFVLFCNRVAVEISKAQSRGMKKEEQKGMWKKTSHWSIKICWPWIETAFLKTKLALPRLSHVELKQQSGKSSLKLNIKLKISKRVLLKLLLYKGSWNSVLRSFNTLTVCRKFLKAIR